MVRILRCGRNDPCSIHGSRNFLFSFFFTKLTFYLVYLFASDHA